MTVPMHTFSGVVEHAPAHIEEAAVHNLPAEQQRRYAIRIFERDRRMVIMTTTFIPCGAKVAFIAMIAGTIFSGSAWVATFAHFIGIAAKERDNITERNVRLLYYTAITRKGDVIRMVFGFGRKTVAENNGEKYLMVNKSRCPQNHHCPSVKVCPVGALSQNGFDAPIADQEKCIRCGKCVKFCPMRALTLE